MPLYDAATCRIPLQPGLYMMQHALWLPSVGRTRCVRFCRCLTRPSRFKKSSTAQASPPTPGLGPPLPHLRRDWAHPRHICTGTVTAGIDYGSEDDFRKLYAEALRVSEQHGLNGGVPLEIFRRMLLGMPLF